MIIDQTILDDLSDQAKVSPRQRMNYNFHQSLEDKCHRFPECRGAGDCGTHPSAPNEG